MKEYNKSSNGKFDLSKSTEFNANCRLNLLFLVSEILSSALQDTDEWLKKAGCELRHEDKKNFKTATKAIAALKAFSGLSKEDLNDFANEADRVYKLLLVLEDRTGEDNSLFFRFYEYLKSFPSKGHFEGLDESESRCFEPLFTKEQMEEASW